jgi:hypothetical protein
MAVFLISNHDAKNEHYLNPPAYLIALSSYIGRIPGAFICHICHSSRTLYRLALTTICYTRVMWNVYFLCSPLGCVAHVEVVMYAAAWRCVYYLRVTSHKLHSSPHLFITADILALVYLKPRLVTNTGFSNRLWNCGRTTRTQGMYRRKRFDSSRGVTYGSVGGFWQHNKTHVTSRARSIEL